MGGLEGGSGGVGVGEVAVVVLVLPLGEVIADPKANHILVRIDVCRSVMGHGTVGERPVLIVRGGTDEKQGCREAPLPETIGDYGMMGILLKHFSPTCEVLAREAVLIEEPEGAQVCLEAKVKPEGIQLYRPIALGMERAVVVLSLYAEG